MSKIIKSIIHNEELGVYAFSISDKVSASTIEKIISLLLKEEVDQEKQNKATHDHLFYSSEPTYRPTAFCGTAHITSLPRTPHT